MAQALEKTLFPSSWQEIPLRSEMTGERHFADVPNYLTVLSYEFSQHSPMSRAEPLSRESFYREHDLGLLTARRGQNKDPALQD